MLYGLDVVQNLLRFGGTDQNRCDLVVVQQPGKGHLGQGLTALPGKVIQGTDLRKRSGVMSFSFKNRPSVWTRLSAGMPCR